MPLLHVVWRRWARVRLAPPSQWISFFGVGHVGERSGTLTTESTDHIRDHETPLIRYFCWSSPWPSTPPHSRFLIFLDTSNKDYRLPQTWRIDLALTSSLSEVWGSNEVTRERTDLLSTSSPSELLFRNHLSSDVPPPPNYHIAKTRYGFRKQ